MSAIDPLLERNRAFAADPARRRELGVRPALSACLITCLDPRVEPAATLGLRLGDAMVLRNAGGRVTTSMIQDVAFLAWMGERLAVGDEPLFEVAVLHHDQCGTAAFADPGLRRGFADRAGYDEEALAGQAVVDPRASVRQDVERLLAAPQVSARIRVSGHVYDMATGLVTTVVESTPPRPRGIGATNGRGAA